LPGWEIMKHKINSKDIEPGMYVCELDRSWLDSPFLFQGFTVREPHEIQQLQDLCSYVYVETDRSDRGVIERIHALGEAKAHRSPAEEKEAHIKPYATLIEEELKTARKIYEESSTIMQKLFEDVRAGNTLQTTSVKTLVRDMVSSITRNPDALVLLGSLHEHSEYSIAHSINVCVLTLNFARYLGYDRDQMYELGVAALLHDIGELKIPADILNKNGLLNQDEKKLVESHTVLGADILNSATDLPPSAVEVALSHHERYNGKGYPEGLPNDKISTMSKIVGIVDVYDSVTTQHNYRPGISSTEALKNMYNWRNELFDGEFVERFIECLGIYPIGSVVELNTAEVGIIISAMPGRRLQPKLMLVRDKKKKPYLPPKILDLSQYANSGTRYDIIKVLAPTAYGIDLKSYLLREMPFELSSVPA
jgi:putative nucleotidyltransferase with HDIG domain